MSSGLQVPGAPSYASRLRGEANPYRSSNAGKHVPNTPSNLGMYSQAHTGTQKPGTADRRLPNNDSSKDNSAKPVRTKSRVATDSWKDDTARNPQIDAQGKQSVAGNPKEGPKTRAVGQQGLVNPMASLSMNPAKKAEPVPMGRALNWERPVSSASSKVSKYLPKSDRDYSKPTPSAYSISYMRTHNQTPMEKAKYREYLPFSKSEFEVGMVIRMYIHESDFTGTSKAAIAQASQASTLVDGASGEKRLIEHRHHGDFGPIYSENRIFIVVNVANDVFTAIPLYTHRGKGLANVADKNSWVSVADDRQPEKCIQQSDHQPLRTAILSSECDILDPVSAAWIPYAFPCRYDVPVAYQGKLNKASAKRLVRLHRATWVDDD